MRAACAPAPALPRDTMNYFIGAKSASWLEQTDVPLFVTYSLLSSRKKLPQALGPWALDSNGFEMLRLHRRYTFSPKQYASDVQRYQREIGKLCFASAMDWMCEEAIIQGGVYGRLWFLGTRLSVREHQRRTIDNYLELRALAPDVPWMPVLQGGGKPEYYDMLDEYARRGVDLWRVPRVGVGSICRKQAVFPVILMLSDLLDMGLTLHAFGFKVQGLAGVVQARAHDLAFARTDLGGLDGLVDGLSLRSRGAQAPQEQARGRARMATAPAQTVRSAGPRDGSEAEGRTWDGPLRAGGAPPCARRMRMFPGAAGTSQARC